MSYYIIVLILIGFLLTSMFNNRYKVEPSSREQSFCTRGLLAMMVIANHIFAEAYMLGNIAVSLFLFLSGYGQGYMVNKKGDEYLFFGRYWKDKVTNILLPYCGINLLYIYWDLFVVKDSLTSFEILGSFFTAKIMPVGWYTIVITLLYALFFAVYKMRAIKWKKLALSLSVCLLIAVLFLLGVGSWWYCSLLSFVMGVAASDKTVENTLIGSSSITGVFACLILMFSYAIAKYFDLYDGAVFLVIKILQSVCVCVIYFFLCQAFPFRNAFLEELGKNSFIIYLIHPLLIRIFAKIGLNISETVIGFVTILVLSLLCSLIYGLCLSRLNGKKKRSLLLKN